MVGSNVRNLPEMPAAAAPSHELPDGLVAQLVDGKVLRPERIAECRRRLAEGPPHAAAEVADAMVREAARSAHPAVH